MLSVGGKRRGGKITYHLTTYFLSDISAKKISKSFDVLRIIHDLVLTYKIIFRLVDVQTSKFFRLRDDIVPTRGKPYKVFLN